MNMMNDSCIIQSSKGITVVIVSKDNINHINININALYIQVE